MIILAQNKEIIGDGGSYEILPLEGNDKYAIVKVEGERYLSMGIYENKEIARNVFNGIVIATANGERVFYMPEENIDKTWRYATHHY